MSHIQVDPFASNGFNHALNPTLSPSPSVSTTNQPNLNMYNLQNMLHTYTVHRILTNVTSTFSMFKTGNEGFDNILGMILQMIILGGVTAIMTQIGTVIGCINRFNSQLFGCMYGLLLKMFRCLKQKICKEHKKYYRTVDIPYISDTRQINELYKAVFWFLTNTTEIDYLHEPYLQFVFDKKINVETQQEVKSNLSIHKILSQKKSKNINFKKHQITYTLSTELITVYTDKDRKRENFKVTLYTIIDEFEKTDILDEFCQHCLTEYINNLTSSNWIQQIYTNKNDGWIATPSNNKRKLDTIILKNGLKDEIKNDLQLFLNSEEWYKERDIPYSRGYLFYGYPGTGKTSMIKGMSLYCKRHIHFLMLSEVKSDGELLDLLKKINYKETVLVIEDIDAMADIVKDRNSISKVFDTCNENDLEFKNNKSTLTLSGLLNAIDGVFTSYGRILIMTTNHPEILDSALIRPGRVDSKFLFSNCDKEQIKGLYEMFFNASVNKDDLDNIKNNEYSPAHITSVFLRYRNKPDDALKHLDDLETSVTMDCQY